MTFLLKVFSQGSQFTGWPCSLQLSCPPATYTEFTSSHPIQEGYWGNRKQAYITGTTPAHTTRVQQARPSCRSMIDSQRLPDFWRRETVLKEDKWINRIIIPWGKRANRAKEEKAKQSNWYSWSNCDLCFNQSFPWLPRRINNSYIPIGHLCVLFCDSLAYIVLQCVVCATHI